MIIEYKKVCPEHPEPGVVAEPDNITIYLDGETTAHDVATWINSDPQLAWLNCSVIAPWWRRAWYWLKRRFRAKRP